ncbi:MAG TPA: hypothetical protein PK073_05845 [Ignavibacteriaceae bacterium]|jgi:hypothetical protein|nr:MAG: hypothetical protein BWY38_01890 [Ignavibacteria bacterium ADurb.Bin266]OQY74207.1 MAG: hypothetical protein B6D44_05200 [Ignavibacteriales bacterium UTCHB2]HQF42417.1 hypothetical protein [Ignavibacteriaceae bacterium]HQI39826.1 hypothetical protein [Ignavibacteriaceae bacterium]HQJ46223.1 hypothetical protein [Ignavibacteriaceae bacterium]
MKTILLILIGQRKQSAVQVQKVLTGWGCMIKTRLGIHDGVMENCSDQGLVILELAGERKKMDELARKVSLIKGVTSKLIELKIPKEKKAIKSVSSKTVK